MPPKKGKTSRSQFPTTESTANPTDSGSRRKNPFFASLENLDEPKEQQNPSLAPTRLFLNLSKGP
ncbi:hypothetical protein B0O99DRAFT_338545 [Bisporella sp. PMI_857]|nr:hypothetical protein B0O99DRAFT_338545 [Bisporella sp. PMI_857]